MYDQFPCVNFASFETAASKETDYYDLHPELILFDNGKGFTTWGINEDVEKKEFIDYGRSKLVKEDPEADPSQAECLARASQDLAAVLKTKSRSVAQDYVTRILDWRARRAFKANGGAEFFPAEEAASETQKTKYPEIHGGPGKKF